jgi:hypothetical protein
MALENTKKEEECWFTNKLYFDIFLSKLFTNYIVYINNISLEFE